MIVYAMKLMMLGNPKLKAIEHKTLMELQDKKASEIKWWADVIEIKEDKVATAGWDNIKTVKLLMLGNPKLKAIEHKTLMELQDKKASEIKWWGD